MAKNIAERIDESFSSFSKGQKRIANAILNNYEKAAYMTAAKLGAFSEVSESTVVRFAVEIGYAGYPEMQQAVRELLRTKLTSSQRIAVTNEHLEDGDLLSVVLNADIRKIKYTLENTDRAVFSQAVDALLHAKRIYIFGSRSSAMLSQFLSYNLELIFDNVKRIELSSNAEVFEKLFSIGDGDVLFVSSFPRYSKTAINVARYAQDRHATVIALTDSAVSPLAGYAGILLTAQSDMASFADSLTAPLSIINALLASVAKEREDEITARFDKLERLWEEYDVYDKH
ncbi:MAG: MurR/RpiR family transcriptional regulator [Ruminococcaceae bacterium]|nr:MurR/RpiR family transcriptional regulator [Oscillospiraceae bacterium]